MDENVERQQESDLSRPYPKIYLRIAELMLANMRAKKESNCDIELTMKLLDVVYSSKH